MSHRMHFPWLPLTDINSGCQRVRYTKMGDDLDKEDYTIANRMYRVAMDSWAQRLSRLMFIMKIRDTSTMRNAWAASQAIYTAVAIPGNCKYGIQEVFKTKRNPPVFEYVMDALPIIRARGKPITLTRTDQGRQILLLWLLSEKQPRTLFRRPWSNFRPACSSHR
jgi:hypothetical protein